MPHPAKTSALLSVLAIVAAATLAGCATAAAPGATPNAQTSNAPEPEEVVEEPISGPDCLVGDWYIEQDQMQVFYDALGKDNGKLKFTIKGGTGLSFTATTYSYAPDFTLLVDIAGIDGRGTITGSIDGSYTADAEKITTSQETNDTELQVTVGGVAQNEKGLFDSILASAPINSAAYQCTPAGPIIQFSTGDGSVPVQLTVAR